MRALTFHEHGGPEVFRVERLPDPEPSEGEVVIAVKAFGINRAETYMRAGSWPQAMKVSGIECVGEVLADPTRELDVGTPVAALMGGMGRVIDGSYAERTRVRRANVVPIDRCGLGWAELAAIPESYATAWQALFGNLRLARGQSLVVRGATSALGQAAVNLAADAGIRVIATTRREDRRSMLREIGAGETLIEHGTAARDVRAILPDGVDAVLDIVGNQVFLDSLAMARPGGRVCQVGFLGGTAPIAAFDPLRDMPVGVEFSLFGSFAFGEPGFSLDAVPLARIVARCAEGRYRACPERIFRFEDIADAHRLMESNEACGKIVMVI
ncbi:MAG TPA: zinc-binding dehydrogenase [Allosphingosinicella sp.]